MVKPFLDRYCRESIYMKSTFGNVLLFNLAIRHLFRDFIQIFKDTIEFEACMKKLNKIFYGA
jgi:hypothetical protein